MVTVHLAITVAVASFFIGSTLGALTMGIIFCGGNSGDDEEGE